VQNRHIKSVQFAGVIINHNGYHIRTVSNTVRLISRSTAVFSKCRANTDKKISTAATQYD